MLKRDTRVQIFIVEGGKYVLLKHHDIKKNLYFWGVPGGGRENGETDEEAAIREAYEETGLKIKLLPIKIEGVPQIKNSMYKRVVTFLAYSIDGKAQVGIEPEPELKQYYELVDMKWKDFYDDTGLDDITYNDINPFRHIIDSNKFIKRKEFVVCKMEDNIKRYLLDYDEKKLEFGFIHKENSVVLKYKDSEALGFFLSENEGNLYKRDIIYIVLDENEKLNEECTGKWFKYEELDKIKLEKVCKKILEKLNKKT
ncbi:NUDIX hydrolase [Clostridiaceae bacterium UIB06]|uniref:NUDIX hydrolase n=1 Tax=Clostridium thailandense TaxID=2794346 RepID=A0A949TXD6_9CLOT|nr:NUDIX hydrolase [Clostridium thailandense]MBV7275291.1 NUDIX hydrolase [Clostridium thailandense]MCH5135807.1 NUDIX hydrolase [Clostridiaceae bacterium UIB06]